jgi:Lon protease-like protein
MDTLALFPLQSTLFPDGYLALQIFEPRYLDLIKRCRQQDLPFGVVALSAGSEVRQREGEGFAAERFHEVGTLARIEHFEQPQPGLMRIRCRGGQRFQLLSSECLPHGLWMGSAELIEADAGVPVPPDLAPVSRLLQTFLHTLETGAAAEDLPLQPPYRWDDCGWLANRWCELLPLPADEKQRLLRLDNPLLRLELVADQLERLGMRPGG